MKKKKTDTNNIMPMPIDYYYAYEIYYFINDK